MSFSGVKLQVLTNRFVAECDEVVQSEVIQQMFRLYKKYDMLDRWKINLFNLICNSNNNECIKEGMIDILSNLDVTDSISESAMTMTPSLINLSTDTLLHCTQFLRLKDLLSLQKCNRHLLIECPSLLDARSKYFSGCKTSDGRFMLSRILGSDFKEANLFNFIREVGFLDDI